MKKQEFSRRDFLKFAGLAAGSAFLAACQQATPTIAPTEAGAAEGVISGAPALRNVKLQFAYYATEGFEDPLYGELLKKWQTGLKAAAPSVDFEPIVSDYQKQAMAMAAGNAAEVSNTNVPSAWPLIYRNQIANLQERIDNDSEWKENMTHYVAAPVDAYTYQGNLFAIPNSVETTGTVYNEDLIAASGAKQPHEYASEEWTWDTFADTARAVTQGEGQDRVWGASMSAEWQSGLGDMVFEWWELIDCRWLACCSYRARFRRSCRTTGCLCARRSSISITRRFDHEPVEHLLRFY